VLDKLTIGGMLLRESIRKDASTNRRIVFKAVADHCVEYGVVSARGWLEGWRYATGNRDDSFQVYQHASAILGIDVDCDTRDC
jgi:hypothetical protein